MDELLAEHSFAVVYSPLASEAPLPVISLETYVVPARKDLDPTAEAARAVRSARDRKTCVLVPGTRFDATGTRHGRGGGWYDRFLAHVPHDWTRIGVCTSNQVEGKPLVRESWDEPVDYLLVTDKDMRLVRTYSR